MFKKIIIISVLLILSINTVFAFKEEVKIDKIYNGFILKIEKKYSLDKEILFLERLSKKINKLFEKNNNFNKKGQERIKNVLGYFYKININKIIKLKTKQNFKKNNQLDNIKNNAGENKEINTSSDTEKNKNLNKINSYDTQFHDKNIEKVFNKYSNISKYFNNKIYNNKQIFLENGVWYTYGFSNYKIFNKSETITISDIKYNGINPERDTIFVTEDNGIGFIVKPKKIKLVSDYIISNVGNKFNFLKEIKSDKKKEKLEKIDYDKEFLDIKRISEKLTKNQIKDEKIKSIYSYIVNNLSYTTNFSLNDEKIFSGVETFKAKNGVCEGYVKLMNYMFLFSGINDAEVIRGYVIDAADFPDIGHAWFKIGSYYYDPTFDDPIGNEGNIKFDDYKYFKLPKDLIYANRFDAETLPNSFKTKSKNLIKKYIDDNLYNLAKKYINKDYNILKPYVFRIKNNFGNKEKLTISDFKKVLINYKVNKDYSFIDENGEKKYVKKLSYFPVSNLTIEYPIRHNFNYNLDGLYILNWELSDGTWQERLVYNLEIK